MGQRGSEIFDVVGENDEVLRQERRDVVHREKLFHRSVHIFVFNSQGQALIQKLGLGRLPGDIVIERENFRLYIPLATSLLVSIVVSIVIWLINR